MSLKNRFFIVTSHGWSASHWFAVALDTHPEVFCFHSALHLHARGDDTSEEHLKNITKDHSQAVNSREDLSIDVAFDQIMDRAKDPKIRIFGNVHTYRLRDLPALKEKFPAPREHRVMNLIRHPVSLINSGFGQLRTFAEWDIFTLVESVASLQINLFELDRTVKKHKLNLTEPNVYMFMGACQHLYHLARDQHIGPESPTIIMERLTTDTEYYAEIIRGLTAGEIECSKEYLNEVFALGAKNKHAQNKKSTNTPAQQFAAWDSWQRDVFLIAFRDSGLKDLYARHGYDFSFI